MTVTQQQIVDAYARMGQEAVAGRGGFFVRDRGFRTTAQARKETSVVARPRSTRGTIGPYGDYAWIAKLNGTK